MKRYPGKIVMAAIILSCGFVMQVEQASEKKMKLHDAADRSAEVAFNDSNPAPNTRVATLHADRSSW